MNANRRKPSNTQLMTVKNLTDQSADLYIYGEIVDNTDWKWDEADVMPDDVLRALNQVDGLSHLNIYINSPGGSVFAGMAIYSMLKRNTAKKIVYVDGVAASMASVIALAGDEIYIPSNAYMMIHKPWTIAVGNADFLMEVAERLDTLETGVMNVYEENLNEGVDIEEVRQMVAGEKWMTGEEAAEYFTVQATAEVNYAACSKDYLKNYDKAPEKLIQDPEPGQNDNTEDLKFQNELALLSL